MRTDDLRSCRIAILLFIALIATTSVAGGGTGISSAGIPNAIRLDNSAVSFLDGASQTFTFNLNTGTGNQTVSVVVNPTSAAGGEEKTASGVKASARK